MANWKVVWSRHTFWFKINLNCGWLDTGVKSVFQCNYGPRMYSVSKTLLWEQPIRSRDAKTRINIKNISSKNLDIVLEYHSSPLVFWLHAYCWRRETLKFATFTYFRPLWPWTLELVIQYTVMYQSSASTYTPNFVQIEKTFVAGWMSRQITRPTLLDRLRRADLNIILCCKLFILLINY